MSYTCAVLKSRLVKAAWALLIVLGLWLVLGVVMPELARLRSGPKALNTAAILREVQTLSQLVTVKHVIEKVIVFEDVKWYGESRVIMVAHGVVKAGVDLGQLKAGNIETDGKKIIVKLPSSAITDSYLDERKTVVVDRSTGLLRRFDKALEQGARRTAVEDIQRAARANGIIKDADERAQMQLQCLFRQLGYEQIEFRAP